MASKTFKELLASTPVEIAHRLLSPVPYPIDRLSFARSPHAVIDTRLHITDPGQPSHGLYNPKHYQTKHSTMKPLYKGKPLDVLRVDEIDGRLLNLPSLEHTNKVLEFRHLARTISNWLHAKQMQQRRRGVEASDGPPIAPLLLSGYFIRMHKETQVDPQDGDRVFDVMLGRHELMSASIFERDIRVEGLRVLSPTAKYVFEPVRVDRETRGKFTTWMRLVREMEPEEDV